MWEKIENAPNNKLLVVGIDSYDCGWVFDTVFKKSDNFQNWEIPFIDELSFAHMKYTHYIKDLNLLNWKHISLAPKDKVLLLGVKTFFGKMLVSSAYWSAEHNDWVATGTCGDRLKLNRKFTMFALPYDRNIGSDRD